MFYKNSLKTKSLSTNKLNFNAFYHGIDSDTDEYLLPMNYSNNTYNFSMENGALTTGLGIEALSVPYQSDGRTHYKELVVPQGVDVLGVWGFSYFNTQVDLYETSVIIYCSDNKLYSNTVNAIGDNFIEMSAITLSELPNVTSYYLNGVNTLIFTNNADSMWVYAINQVPYQITDAPNITSMCIHFERMFVTVDGEKNQVWFSDDLDPTNWTVSLNEAGFIQLNDERGPLNKVISLNDYVYVFRDFGISRITAYAEQEQFSVNHLYLSSNKIYAKTVAACGDNVFYLAQDGVYVFNGVTSTKLDLKIDNMLKANDNAVADYYNGKYYLAVKLNFLDDEKVGSEIDSDQEQDATNALLEIDVQTCDLNILRGVNILTLKTINDIHITKLVALVKEGETIKLGQISKSGTVFGQETKKYWQSPYSDLGYPDKDKLIQYIYVKNSHDFTLVVQTDKTTKTIEVAGSSNVNKVKINAKGKLVRFGFVSQSDLAHISKPQVIFSTV